MSTLNTTSITSSASETAVTAAAAAAWSSVHESSAPLATAAPSHGENLHHVPVAVSSSSGSEVSSLSSSHSSSASINVTEQVSPIAIFLRFLENVLCVGVSENHAFQLSSAERKKS